MLTPNALAILSQAYSNIGVFALRVAQNIEAGSDGTPEQDELYEKGVKATVLYDLIIRHLLIKSDGTQILAVKASATDTEINALLFCLKEVAEVFDLPAIPKPLVITYTNIYAGPAGPTGPAGQSTFLYIGYATDGAGAGFASTPDPTRKYIALRVSTTALTYTVSIFAGLWTKYLGDNGATGAAGTNGTNSYFYQAWADDAIGTNFTLTFSGTKKYTAFKLTTAPLSPPIVGDFAGLWTKYVGDNGSNGTNGTNGFSVLSGVIDPSGGIGVDGDFYINYGGSPWKIFGPKAAGAWPAGVTMKGDVGDPGADGADGVDGAATYTYIAWADDSVGTGFTNTFNPNKDYVAILVTTTFIPTTTVADFTGLWSKYRGDGDNWTTNSNTSQTIGTGVKVWVVATDLAYSTGQRAVASVPSDPTNRMEGVVQGYDPTNGQLTINVDTIYGSGTYGTWDISLQGAPISIASVQGYFATIATDQGSGGSTQATSTTPAKLTGFDTIVSQSAGMTPSHSSDNITVLNPGSYNVAFQGVISGSASADFIFQVYKNGSAVANAITRVLLNASGHPQNVNIGPLGISGVNANDVFEIRVSAASGTPNVLMEQGSFTLYSVGATNTAEYLKIENLDVDIGTEDVDLISTSLVKSVIWEMSVQKSTNIKTVIIIAATNGNTGGSDTSWSEAAVVTVGTVDITFSVDVNSGNLRLRATATTNDWIVKGLRRIISA